MISVLKALAVQIIALLLILLIGYRGWLPQSFPVNLFALAWLQAMFAVFLAYIFASPGWWLLIHLFFMPVVVWALTLNLPGWVYFIGFIILLLIYWTSFHTQVPLFLSNRKTVEQLAAWLPTNKPLRVLDVGSGIGSFVRFLAILRPDWQITGIETAPAPYGLSRWLARRQKNLRLQRGNFWHESLRNYDVVYAFLSPVPMPKLWEKAEQEMYPGSYLISNSFAIPDQEPYLVIEINDYRKTCLYCYQINNKKLSS